MKQLIWVVFLAGLVASAFFFGRIGGLVYLAGMSAVISVFRRPIVLALTHLSVKTGGDKQVIDGMPAAIHLVQVDAPAASARPLVETLRACAGLVDAGSWSITEMPKIAASLLVDPARGMLVVVESAQPVGAYVNIHTLYEDGRVVSFTSTELPLPPRLRPNVTRNRIPKCPPRDLLERARKLPSGDAVREISAADAPRVYEELYAAEIAFRKTPLPTATARA